MIRYTLICANEHEFESWFKDAESFDRLSKTRRLECPTCGDTEVAKAVMAPGLVKGTASRQAAEARAHEVAREILTAVGEIREKVERDFDDVGDQLAEEARKIHYGESDERGIYGDATPDEVVELTEEGINVVPLPGVKRKNKKKISDA